MVLEVLVRFKWFYHQIRIPVSVSVLNMYLKGADSRTDFFFTIPVRDLSTREFMILDYKIKYVLEMESYTKKIKPWVFFGNW